MLLPLVPRLHGRMLAKDENIMKLFIVLLFFNMDNSYPCFLSILLNSCVFLKFYLIRSRL